MTSAWCWHPNFIEEEKIIFILEPRVAGVAEDERTADPGLRYLVRTRVIAYQDWSTPPGTPDDLGGDNGHGNDDDDDGHGGHHGDNNGGARDGFDEPPHPHGDIDYPYADDSDDDGSTKSNHNRGHPGQDYRRRGPPANSVHVGQVLCPLTRGRMGHAQTGGGREIPDNLSERCADLRPWASLRSLTPLGNRHVAVVEPCPLLGHERTPASWSRWPTMSAPGTPKISPVRVSCRANLLASADLAVYRDNDVHRSGEVGRFLDIAPLLLHAGCSL